MNHLGMELNAIKTPRMMRHGCFRRVLRVGKTDKSIRQMLDGIAMAHPHR